MIPITLLEEDIYDPDHSDHIHLQPLLAGISSHHFGIHEKFMSDGYDSQGRCTNSYFLSLDKLQASLRELCIPMQLSATILNLYLDFTKSLSNPFLFDNVLDLYDLFASVHRLIVEDRGKAIEAYLIKVPDEPNARFTFLNATDIRDLTAITDLMENALTRRMQLGYQQARRWQEAIDIGGGLIRMVHASDVPLKCGLSMLRRVLRKQLPSIFNKDLASEKDYGNDAFFRARIGGASKISNSCGTEAYRFAIGDNNEHFIVELNRSIAHLTRPAMLTAHIHETGHLIADLIREGNDDGSICERCQGMWCNASQVAGVNGSGINSILRDQLSEIFAEMFTFGVLFKEDIEATRRNDDNSAAIVYFRHYISMFYLDPISRLADEDIWLIFAKMTSYLFLSIHPWMESMKVTSVYSNQYRDKPNYDAIVAEYWSILDESGPMFDGYNKIASEYKEEITNMFRNIYKRCYKAVCCIWDDVSTIVDNFCSEVSLDGECGTSPYHGDMRELAKQFNEGYSSGRPIIRFLYTDPNWDANENRMRKLEKRKHLDAVYVMRQLLNIHLKMSYSDIDMTKETCFLKGVIPVNGLNVMLLDKGSTGFVSWDFKAREEYLRSRASVLLTLWDLSTAIRARSFSRILHMDIECRSCKRNPICAKAQA